MYAACSQEKRHSTDECINSRPAERGRLNTRSRVFFVSGGFFTCKLRNSHFSNMTLSKVIYDSWTKHAGQKLLPAPNRH